MVASQHGSAWRALLSTATGNGGIAALGLATGVLVARLLGPSGTGELTAVQLVPTFVATVAMLGLSEALVFFSSKCPEQGRGYLATAMTVAALASFSAAGVTYWLLPLVLRDESHAILFSARVYLLIGPVLVLAGLPFHSLRGYQRFASWNLLRVLPSLSWLLVICLAGYVLGATAQGLAIAYLGALAVLGFAITGYVVATLPGTYRPRVRFARQLLSFGLPAVLTTLPQILNLRLDQVILIGLIDAEQLGFYVVAVAVGAGVVPVAIVAGQVLFPRVAAMRMGPDDVLLIAQGVRFAALASLMASVGVSVAVPFLLPLLFGDQYRSAVVAACILSIASGVWGFGHSIEEVLRGLNRQRSIILAEVVGLVSVLITILPLVHTAGIVGAALCSIVGYTITVLLLVRGLNAAIGLSARSLVIRRRDVVLASRLLRSGLARR